MTDPVIHAEQGMRWLSTADRNAATRELWRSARGHVSTYETFAGAVSQADVAGRVEALYVLDGTVERPADGTTHGVGDLVFHRHLAGGALRFHAGTQVVRFAWPGAATGETLHVFGDQGRVTSYHGAPVTVRVAAASADDREIVFYGTLPDGVAFTEQPGDLEETFLIVAGEIRCVPAGGRPITWRAGDLVYWPYDRALELEYSVGLGCICFFWSPAPLPDFRGEDATISALPVEGARQVR